MNLKSAVSSKASTSDDYETIVGPPISEGFDRANCSPLDTVYQFTISSNFADRVHVL